MSWLRQGALAKMRRRIVLVSGCPGAGKTTLARPLAQLLGFALFSKDNLKETIFDAMQGAPGDREFSRKAGAAAMELIWHLALQTTEAVLEANFRPHSQYERDRIAHLNADVVEVHCDCDPALARRRYAERAKTKDRHPAHVLAELTDEHLAEFDRPMNVGAVISVDTSRPVDVAQIADEALTHFSALGAKN